jgi:hypothetical protein
LQFENDIVDGVSTALNGHCIVTDKDGDKAFIVYEGKAVHLGLARAPSSGPVAPGDSLGFRETTLSRSPLLTRTLPPRLCGRASGDCRDNPNQEETE